MERKSVPLWRQNEAKAQRCGERKTSFQVKENPRWTEFQDLGQLVARDAPERYKVVTMYKGNWLHDQKHGFGIEENAQNGEIYEGDFRNNLRDGTGSLFVSHQGKFHKKYAGEWKKNKRHGNGKSFSENGEIYDGQWKQDFGHGHGKLQYNSGDFYEGSFENGKRHGLGVICFQNGNRFEGEFVNDLRHGLGKMIFAEKGQILVGVWEEDVMKSGEVTDITNASFPPLELQEQNDKEKEEDNRT